MEAKTYPTMNARIVDLLKLSSDPIHAYAAKRIEELEAENERLRELLQYEEDRPRFDMDANGHLTRHTICKTGGSQMRKCCYVNCEREATTEGFVFARNPEGGTEIATAVQACDEHKNEPGFFEAEGSLT
ncbi:hypothetical protein ACTID9_00925 [Brevibacillus fluminis]|uniref:hypothetical protein n=1 Tax=Brevibacillus fluminis TaxID=511487 RepID=UPI003F8B1F11